jgi:hypothetical protein
LTLDSIVVPRQLLLHDILDGPWRQVYDFAPARGLSLPRIFEDGAKIVAKSPRNLIASPADFVNNWVKEHRLPGLSSNNDSRSAQFKKVVDLKFRDKARDEWHNELLQFCIPDVARRDQQKFGGTPRKNVGADKPCILGNDDSLLAVCELDNLLVG